MDKEEYYKRIERINNRIKTDRVSADEEYQLVCQRNYLSTKYIEHLEQQCKKQKEVIDNAIEYIEKHTYHDTPKKLQNGIYERGELIIKNDFYIEDLVDILKEVSE